MGCVNSTDSQFSGNDKLNKSQNPEAKLPLKCKQIPKNINSSPDKFIESRDTAFTPLQKVTEWDEFSQKERVVQMLSKEKLNIEDIQFLILQEIWREDWFQQAKQLLNIPGKQYQTAVKHEKDIMKLYLLVMLKDATFLQNQQYESLLCEQCYIEDQEQYRLNSKQLNMNLFSECKKCHGIGWKKGKKVNAEDNKNCTKCHKALSLYNIEQECQTCSSLGYIWKL